MLKPMTERERINVVRHLVKVLQRIAKRDPKLINGRILRLVIYYLVERPELHKLSKDHPHSIAARNLRKKGETRRLRFDHAIPLARLTRILQKASTSYEAMRTALRKYVRGAIITDREHARLDAKGLKQKMPKGARSVTARYEAAGIRFSPDDWGRLRR